ncbi:MAG TPA: pitrilysin family protein [Pyrinomonadaceae bacterium]|nr:pitrilysin family protein [Pyrinomonadaceae bacterium]
MKKFNFSIALLLALCFCLNNVAAQTTAPVTRSSTDAVTEVDVNGLKVLVKRRPSSPTVAAGLFVRGGSQNLTAATAGIENMTLNVAAEGSKTYPRAALRKEMSSTGSSVGAGSNQDYSVMSMASTRQNFERSWKVFADLAMNPSFAPDDVELVRERILTGLRGSDDSPEGSLASLEEKVIYAGHPYSNDPSGTIETVSRFKAENLRAYHQKIMQTSQLLLIIVGDVDAAGVQKIVADTLGKLPRGTYKPKPVPAISFSKPTLDVTSRALQTNYVEGIFAAPSLGSPDYYAMRVAVSVLAGRVFQEVRVKNNLSYAPGAEMSNMAANTANISVSAIEANRAVSLMLSEIDKLKTVPIERSDILETGGYFLTTYYIKQETNAAQAAELATYELIGGGWRNSGNFLDRIRSVTPADVQRVSQTYFKNIRFVVIGNPAQIDRSIFVVSE